MAPVAATRILATYQSLPCLYTDSSVDTLDHPRLANTPALRAAFYPIGNTNCAQFSSTIDGTSRRPIGGRFYQTTPGYVRFFRLLGLIIQPLRLSTINGRWIFGDFYRVLR